MLNVRGNVPDCMELMEMLNVRGNVPDRMELKEMLNVRGNVPDRMELKEMLNVRGNVRDCMELREMLNVRGNVPDMELGKMSNNALNNSLSSSLKFGDVGLKQVRQLESLQRFCELFPHRVQQEGNTESSVAFAAGKTGDCAWRQGESRRYAQPGKEIELKARLSSIPECPHAGDDTFGQRTGDRNKRVISGQLDGKDPKRGVGDAPLKKNFTPSASTTAVTAKENNHGVDSPCMALAVANKNSNYTPNACDRAPVANLAVNCPKLNLARPDMAVLQPCQIDVLLSLAATEASCSVMIENCKYALLSCDVDQMITNYLIAAKFQLSDVMDRLLDQIRCRFPNVCRTHEFLSLPVDVVEMFLTDGELQVETELDVFFAALTWIDFNKMDRLRHAGRVLKCVRYVYIDPRDIMTYIEPNIHLFTGIDGMEALLNMYRYKALVLSGTIPPPVKELYVPGGIPPPAPQEGVYPFGFTADTSPIRNEPEPLPEYAFNMDSFRRQIAACYHRHGFVDDQQSRQVYGPESPCQQGSREISLRGICGMDSHRREVVREHDSHLYGPVGGSEGDWGVSPWCKPDYHPGTQCDYRSPPFRERDHDFNRGPPGQGTDYAAIRRRIRSFKKGPLTEMDPIERRHSGEDHKKVHSGEDGKERHGEEGHKERHGEEGHKERHGEEGHKERHGEEGQKEIIQKGKDGKEHPKRGKDHKDRHRREGRKELDSVEGHKERHSEERRKSRRPTVDDRRGSSVGLDGGEDHKERHGEERRKSRRPTVDDRRGSSVGLDGGEDHKERHGEERRKSRRPTVDDRRGSSVGLDGGEDHKERHGEERRKSRRPTVDDRRGSSVGLHGGEDHKERRGGEDRKERHGGERRKSRRPTVDDRRGSSEELPQTKRHESQPYQDDDDTPLAKILRKQVSFTGLPAAEANLDAKADKGDKKKKKKKREKGDRSQERDRSASKGSESIDLSQSIHPVDDVSADEPTSKGTSSEDLGREYPGMNNNARKCKTAGVIGENEPIKVRGQCTFRTFSSRPCDEKGFQDIEFLDDYRDALFPEESINDDISFSRAQNDPIEQAPCQRGRSWAKRLPGNFSRPSQDFPAVPPSAKPHLGHRGKTCPGLSRRKGHRVDQRCRSLSLRSGRLP